MSLINEGVLQTDITDNFPTCISIPVNSNYKSKEDNFIYSINEENILMMLNEEKWSNVSSNNDANKFYFEFQKIISNAFDRSTVSKVVNSKNRCLKE